MRALSAAALAALAFFTATHVAAADEHRKLKITSLLPASHYLWEHGLNVFTKSVTEGTQNGVGFEAYPAAQLGKDFYGVLNSGLSDISMILTAYSPDKFPMSSVAELPGFYSSSCEATAKFWHLAKPGGVLAESEYDPLGLHVIFVHTSSPFQLMTASKKVEKPEAMRGLKIWAGGSGISKSVESLGAVPIQLTSVELYDAVTRGTVDGAAFPYLSTMQYNLNGHLKYALEGLQLGSGSFIVAMTNRTWDGLTDDQRAVITQAGMDAQKKLCAWVDGENDKARDRFVAEDGLVVTTLTAEEAKVWGEALQSSVLNWSSTMDAAGKDGKKLVEAMRNAAGEM